MTMMNKRTRVTYYNALEWMALNDDCEWLRDETPILSVTASMVADLFGVPSTDKIIADLRKVVKRIRG